MNYWIVASIDAFFVTFFLTYFLKKVALRHNWLDEPNHRSSHETPTPKSGGVGFTFAICLAWIVGGSVYGGDFLSVGGLANADGNLNLDGISNLPILDFVVALMICGVVIALIGLLDDKFHLPPLWRLVSHFIASGVVLFFLPKVPALAGFSWLPTVLVFALLLIAIVWFINLFNFMDGIDGIATVEAMSILLGLLIIVWLKGTNFQGAVNILLPIVMALVAFLFWNWSPAKIFMGDVGSGFLGLILPGLMLFISWLCQVDFVSVFILTGVFVIDATVTLFRRFFDGQKLSEAHRSHTYQIYARRWQSHSRVSLLTGVINMAWLLPLSLASATIDSELYTWILLAVAWFPLVVIAYRSGAGLKND